MLQDQIEVAYVRGAEVEGMLDANGHVIEEFGECQFAILLFFE